MVIRIEAGLMEAMQAQARGAYPEECCGMLIGKQEADGWRVMEIAAVENVAEVKEKRRRYVAEPRGILGADREAREKGLDVVGVYHSHPDEAAMPSARDEAEAWERFLYVIVAVTKDGAGGVRGWWFLDGRVEELAIISR